MKLSLCLLAALAIAAPACMPSSPTYDFVAPQEPTNLPAIDGALVVAQGSALAIEPYINREELEGSSDYPVNHLTSDDPTIAKVAPTSNDYDLPGVEQHEHAWVISGVAAGVTKLRFRDGGGSELGSIDVHVVVQDP